MINKNQRMDLSSEMASPTAMKELIQYFEIHGQQLDQQKSADIAPALTSYNSTSFVSCIRFNGTPILPPVMTSGRLEEVQEDRHRAILKEKHYRVKQRQHLMAVANVHVENTEAGPASETRTSKTMATKLPLERPLVLKPVVTSAWGSVSPNVSTVSSVQSLDSTNATRASSVGNTFATAEQGQEEFGLHTLDSVCSELLLSLEETLPTDFNGVPLTSVTQQKISHDLLRLSKILKVRDLNSTGGSEISDLPTSECLVGTEAGNRAKSDCNPVQDKVSSSFHRDSNDTMVSASNDTITEYNSAGFTENSTDVYPAEFSSPTDRNPSGAGSANSSGTSSGNTTSTTDSHKNNRSSPRSNNKNNTVHFASFVTEYIDTSASLSSENITVVKKKLPRDRNVGNKSEARSNIGSGLNSEMKLEDGENMEGLLRNVSLAEPESPVSLNAPALPPTMPFQSYSKEPSSDKENDAKQTNKQSGWRNSACSSSEARSSPKPRSVDDMLQSSAPHGGVSDSQCSSKSDGTAVTSESSNSTLKEEASAVSGDSITELPMNIVEDKSDQKEPLKTTNNSVTHKTRVLPPEPIQNSVSQQLSRHSRELTSKSSGSKEKGNSGDSGHKGHVRRGSYTLSQPSPALLNAQGREVGQSGGGNRDCQNDMNKGDDEDHTKPLNIPVQSSVPSEPETTGKAEHINKYLSQVQLHNSEDVTSSYISTDLSQHDPTASAQLQSSFNILQSLTNSQKSLMSAASNGEALQEFQTLRQNLLDQQQKELEELFIQQRKQQMQLQAEIEEHHNRMKEQQQFLASNAPENYKVPSQAHEGELSPDANTGENVGISRFNFPSAKNTQVNLQPQSRAVSGALTDSPLLNISSSSASPKVQRPILRSPVKFHPGRKHAARVTVPPEAHAPDMQVKFEKITALAKGFLCRRLLLSDKVQELLKTIKDTREFAFSFQAETPIKKGNFSNQDRTLLERIVAQLQAALLDVHNIFFDTPIPEQMALIEQTRLNSRERRLKSSSEDIVRSSAPRISTATLKAQERRRRAQEAESAVFGASISRPRTAPPTTNSARSHASVDLSGPLKRHYQFLLSRAMKPAAMQAAHQHSHVSSSQLDTSRSDMERPQTAPERPNSARTKKTNSSSATASSHATDNAQAKFNIRPKQVQQQTSQSANSKSSKVPTKSSKWR